MQFVLFIDEVGAEFVPARMTRRHMVAAIKGRVLRARPLELRPLEVLQPPGKIAGRAAGGYLLAGPLGAALGVLTGKGAAVRFELVFPDRTLRGMIEQNRYGALRRRVEAMQKARDGDLGETVLAWLGVAILAVVLTAAMGPMGLVVGAGAVFTARYFHKRANKETEA